MEPNFLPSFYFYDNNKNTFENWVFWIDIDHDCSSNVLEMALPSWMYIVYWVFAEWPWPNLKHCDKYSGDINAVCSKKILPIYKEYARQP